jgi:hypothetical protein
MHAVGHKAEDNAYIPVQVDAILLGRDHVVYHGLWRARHG